MKYLVGVLLLLIGIALGLGIDHYYPIFKFEEKINLIDLCTLLVTIFLAVYIPMFLEKNMHNKRYEKDVTIRRIEALQLNLKQVDKTVTECVQKNAVSNANAYLIINYFTNISNELDTLITFVEHCHKKKFADNLNAINQLRHQYRTAVTGGNFQKKDFKYSALAKKEEELIYHKLDKELCMLIFKITEV